MNPDDATLAAQSSAPAAVLSVEPALARLRLFLASPNSYWHGVNRFSIDDVIKILCTSTNWYNQNDVEAYLAQRCIRSASRRDLDSIIHKLSPPSFPGGITEKQLAKICKQFTQTGTCTFGSRCLYNHQIVPLVAAGLPVYQPQQSVASPVTFYGPVGQQLIKQQRQMLSSRPSNSNNYSSAQQGQLPAQPAPFDNATEPQPTHAGMDPLARNFVPIKSEQMIPDDTTTSAPMNHAWGNFSQSSLRLPPGLPPQPYQQHARNGLGSTRVVPALVDANGDFICYLPLRSEELFY